jgi:flagellar protein FlbD
MIELTQLSGKRFWLNPHLIESMESNPDTTLVLTDGKRIIVKEGADEVIRKVIDYRRSIGLQYADE